MQENSELWIMDYECGRIISKDNRLLKGLGIINMDDNT
jgi:hypothetical protein